MTQTYRVGLVGCGRMGATIDDEVRDRPNSERFLPYSHAAAIVACRRTVLAAVCDPVGERARQAGDRHAAGAVYTDYCEMIDREQLDIISIATRPGPHAATVVFAAENGVKAVYCEKPLCNSMIEADSMLQACRRHGVKFNYGTQRRYVALYRHIRQMIQDGAIGELQAVVAHCGVGAAQWGHTHAADMMLFLAGDGEIDFVQGHALIEESDWDGQRLTKDAALASGFVQFKSGVRAYLVGTEGYEFEAGGSTGNLRTQSNGVGYVWRKADQFGSLTEVDGPAVLMESGTLRAFDDLARALDEDGDTQGGLEVACRSQEIVLALIESERLNGVRVSLPLVNRELAVAPDHY